MSKLIATEASVINAAEFFLQQGIHPQNITNAMILKKLGGGSLSTIGPILKNWIEQKISATITNIDVPQEFEEAVEEFCNKMWLTSLRLAHDKFAPSTEELNRLNSEIKIFEELYEENVKENNQLKQQIRANQEQFVSVISCLSSAFSLGCGKISAKLESADVNLNLISEEFNDFYKTFNEQLTQSNNNQTDLLALYMDEVAHSVDEKNDADNDKADMPVEVVTEGVLNQSNQI